MATFQMPKVARGVRLQPAAPRKPSLTDSNNNNNGHAATSESLATISNVDIWDPSERKENVAVTPIRASRRTVRLEKPRPLKTAAKPEQRSHVDCDNNTQIENQSESERLQMEQNRKMTPESARLVSEKLIRESLKDLNNMPAKLETSDMPPDMSGRTRLLSQVSEDSGYGEMSAYSRQGSMLESLEENEDDVEMDISPSGQKFSPGDSAEPRHTGERFLIPREWLEIDEVCTSEDGQEVRKATLMRIENNCIDLTEDDSCYPEDIDLIELELRALAVDDIEEDERSLNAAEENQEVILIDSDEENNQIILIDSDEEMEEVIPPPKTKQVSPFRGYVVQVREPITPLTMMEEVYWVESRMPGGLYSAKGRRRMFYSHKMCMQEEKEEVSTPSIRRYSANELLRIAYDSVCRVPPESWPYLCEIIPDVCLPRVMKYFDPQNYIDERSYVETQIGYVKDVGMNETAYRSTASSEGSRHVYAGQSSTGQSTERRTLWKPATRSDTGTSQHGSQTWNQSTGNNQQRSQTWNQSSGNNQQRSQTWNQSSDNKLNNQPSGQTWNNSSESQKIQNHSTTKTFQTGSQVKVDGVDLNTKCDVSVRNTGNLTIPTRNGFRPSMNIKTIPETTFTPPWMKKSQSTLCSSKADGEDESLYVNRDIPEKCPW